MFACSIIYIVSAILYVEPSPLVVSHVSLINIKNHGEVETVDEFETYKEAKQMVIEYRIADRTNDYYLSSRATKEWRNKE